jgi:hypothetical protein
VATMVTITPVITPTLLRKIHSETNTKKVREIDSQLCCARCKKVVLVEFIAQERQILCYDCGQLN